jgi:hypothetical protein
MNLEIKLIEKLEVEIHDDYKFEHEYQDYTKKDNQNSIEKDFTQSRKSRQFSS